MPISKYNPDGTVDIYNSKTGEVKTGIYPQELSTISPKLMVEYQKAQAPETVLARKEAETKLKTIETGGADAKSGADAKVVGQIKSGLTSIDRIKKTLGGENYKEGEGLSSGNLALLGARTGEVPVLGDVTPWGRGLESDLFNSVDIILRQRSGAAVPPEEVKRYLKIFGPAITDPPKVREQKINQIQLELEQVANSMGIDPKKLIKGEDKMPDNPPILQDTTPSFQNAPDLNGIATIVPDVQTQETKKKEDSGIDLQDIAGKTSGALPAIGGVIGGLGGGILGGTAGSIVPGAGTTAGAIAGSAGGTALGTGAGVFMENSLKEIANIQDKSSAEVLKQAFGEAATAGALDAATFGAFKLVSGVGGMVLKPIGKAIAEGVKDIPLKALRISPAQLTTFAEKHGVDMGDFVIKNRLLGDNALDLAAGKAGELQKAFDNLALNEDIKIPVSTLSERFKEEVAKLAPSSDKLVPSEFKGIAKKVVEEWASILEQIKNQGIKELDPKMLTELRKRTDDLIPESAFVDPNVKNVYLRLRGIYNDVVQEAVDKTLLAPATGGAIEESGLKSLGRELSKYYDFLSMAEKQSNLGRGSLVPNLTRLLSVGFGAGVGGVPGMIGGLALESSLRNPDVLSKLYTAGKKVPQMVSGVGNAIDAAGKVIAPIVGAGVGSMVGR